MKKNILNTLLIGACLLTVTSCDLNDWNNGLDGFEGDKTPVDVQTIEYTLTDADYANIAANRTNIALAGEEHKDALKAVGKKHFFTKEITPQQYVPAFFKDTKFPYFTLDDGSAVKLTYKMATDMPEIISRIEAASTFELEEADYQTYVWESEDRYVNSFTPSKKADNYMNTILKDRYDDAVEGAVAYVTYNESKQEPVFGGSTPEVPEFPMTSVLGSLTFDQEVEVAGIVAAMCARGFVLADAAGSVLVYYKEGFDPTQFKIGDQVTLKGKVGAYNKGFQFDGTVAEIMIKGNQEYTYPAPVVYTGAQLDEAILRPENASGIYAQITATAAVGKFVNLNVEGAQNAVGSLYQATDEQKAMFTDGQKVVVTGYFLSISTQKQEDGTRLPKYANFVPVTVTPVNTVAAFVKAAAMPEIPMSQMNDVYEFDGNNWKLIRHAVTVDNDDYLAMGQKYGNLSKPEQYLPNFMLKEFPYAKTGDSEFVVFKYYANKETTIRCDKYVFDGAVWSQDLGIVQEKAQFVNKKNVWVYDPSVVINLAARSELSKKYYQTCVDWVGANVKDGKKYINAKYGNNEYYCGTNAYQGNIDVRPGKAVEQYPEGYAGMNDDEVLALMKKRFETEVMPGALSILHPDAAPVEGIDVIFTINFETYDGTGNQAETIKFKVVAPAKFEFVECTWNK